MLIKQYFEPLFVNNFTSPYVFVTSTLPLANISTFFISIAVAIYSGSFKPSQWNDPAVTNMNEELNKTHYELCFILYQQLKMPESPCAPPALLRGHCSAPAVWPDANPRSHPCMLAPAQTPLYFFFSFPSLGKRVYICRRRGGGASGGEGKAARRDAMRCDVVRCGAMWCDAVRCGGSTTPSPRAPGWRGTSTLCCSNPSLLPTALGTVRPAPAPQHVPWDDAPGTPVPPCAGIRLYREHRMEIIQAPSVILQTGWILSHSKPQLKKEKKKGRKLSLCSVTLVSKVIQAASKPSATVQVLSRNSCSCHCY